MIALGREDVSAPLYLPDPVNRQHPLNQGRVAWWMAVPGLDGGKFWYDLMGLFPATLTNGPLWKGTARPGGWGHLLFDGTDDYALTTYNAAPGTGNLTWGCSVRFTAAQKCGLISFRQASDFQQFSLLIAGDVNGNTTGSQFLLVDIGAGTTSNRTVLSPSGYTDLAWHRVICVRDGGATRLYVDGVQVATASGAQGNINASNTLLIGVLGNGAAPVAGYYSNSNIDDVVLAGRAWTPAEVKMDFDLSRCGYPGVLNRVESVFYSIAAAATTTPAFRQSLLGVGF